MSGPSYYNEFDPQAAAWLRELIARNLIAPGDVDTRSITEVQPDDLRGYSQCHQRPKNTSKSKSASKPNPRKQTHGGTLKMPVNKPTREDVMKASNAILDSWAAFYVMGWHIEQNDYSFWVEEDGSVYDGQWNPSKYPDRTRMILDKIDRMIIMSAFLGVLSSILKIEYVSINGKNYIDCESIEAIILADPREITQAAIITVVEADGKP